MTLAALVLAAATYDCPAVISDGGTVLWQGCQTPATGLLYAMDHADQDDALKLAAAREARILRACALELETTRGELDTTWIAAGVGLLVGTGLGVLFGGDVLK